jgi:hypothetical protein
MNEDYIAQLMRMMNDIEERSEYMSDNEYLLAMNNCMQCYLNYRNNICICTDTSFECYHYPILFKNCRNKDIIIQQAPLMSILIPGHQIPDDFKLQLEIKYEPYNKKLIVKILRYLFNLSSESLHIFDKIICAFSVFHIIFKYHGLLIESQSLREATLNKLIEFETSIQSRNILENFDFSYLGISTNPIPIWREKLFSVIQTRKL